MGWGSIPGQGAKILKAVRCDQKTAERHGGRKVGGDKIRSEWMGQAENWKSGLDCSAEISS